MEIGRFTPLETKIYEMLEPSVNREGFRLVQVRLVDRPEKTLQLMIDRQSGGAITVDDCAAISDHVSVLLDVEDPIDGHYNLEVSSPGMDRPLTISKDFKDHVGYEVKIVADPIEGRKNFRGALQEVLDDAVEIVVDNQAVRLPFIAIHSAKLVITDALVNEALKQQQQQQQQ